MSAIYIHIPFCRKACHYCDFHFSTQLNTKTEMVAAIIKEIALQANYLGTTTLDSIYFGGGTPSLLTERELQLILEQIYRFFSINPDAEITLEANPDDFSQFLPDTYRKLGINRLSIGIQTFHEVHLKFLNRLHDSEQAKTAVRQAQDAGIDRLSIDLIYGIPANSHTIWENDLAEALQLEVSHISSYCLTIEEKTVFGKWLKQKKMRPIDDDFASQQFEILINTLQQNGYEHYEISNFAREKSYAKHNSHYWTQGAYLGIGPSAHSYNGNSRQYNIANNALYIKSIQQGKVPYQKEILSKTDQINEYLMTHLRTQWGIDLDLLKDQFEENLVERHPILLNTLIAQGFIRKEENKILLTHKGKFLADEISIKLFI